MNFESLTLDRHVVVNGQVPLKKPKPDMSARVFRIYHEMFKFIHKREGMKIIAVEGPSYVRGSASMEQLARCRQSVYDMAAFFLDDFIWIEVAPTQAKRAATGKGSATKEEVAGAAYEKAGGDPDVYSKYNYTIGDAVAVALAAAERYGNEVRSGRLRELG